MSSAKPSHWWMVVLLIAAAISATAAVGAILYQRGVSRPIGEGQLFLEDAQRGLAQIDTGLASGTSADDVIRHLRNSLQIEGVALVDDQGAITAATSDSLLGTNLTNPVLRSAMEAGRFGAVASPIDQDLEIDGVPEWHVGDVLYLALMPGDGPSSNLLLYYDVSELLGRRIRAAGIQTETIQLSLIAVFFALASLAALIGRSRSLQRYREMEIEAEFLRKESQALQAHNEELQAARAKAERALALAEETNRIRSEFVLMINHELRTPLTSVVTGAEILRLGGSLDAEEDQILESLIHDGQRLQAMIDQLLALARVENRGLSFTPQQMSMGKVCLAAVGSHPQIRHPDRSGSDHDDGDLQVVTDLQTLTQLVASLVDNAYTHGATAVEVTCGPEVPSDPQLVVGDRPSAAAYISIADDGPGIRREFLPRAFEKFEKDSRSSGTGLGLYMARLMSDAIGSSLLVWTSSRGTTISIAIPLVEARTTVGAS